MPSKSSGKDFFKEVHVRFVIFQDQVPFNAPFLNGLLPVDCQEVKRPLRTESAKRPINEWKTAHQRAKTAHSGQGAGWRFSPCAPAEARR